MLFTDQRQYPFLGSVTAIHSLSDSCRFPIIDGGLTPTCKYHIAMHNFVDAGASWANILDVCGDRPSTYWVIRLQGPYGFLNSGPAVFHVATVPKAPWHELWHRVPQEVRKSLPDVTFRMIRLAWRPKVPYPPCLVPQEIERGRLSEFWAPATPLEIEQEEKRQQRLFRRYIRRRARHVRRGKISVGFCSLEERRCLKEINSSPSQWRLWVASCLKRDPRLITHNNPQTPWLAAIAFTERMSADATEGDRVLLAATRLWQ